MSSSVSVIPQEQKLRGKETVLHARTAALRTAVKVVSTVSITTLDVTNFCHSA